MMVVAIAGAGAVAGSTTIAPRMRIPTPIAIVSIAASFDKETCKWQYLGEHSFDEDRQSEKAEKILEFLTLSGPSTPRDIADGCGIGRASIYTYLNRLNGKIEKSSHGIYGVKLTTVN